MIAKLTTWQTVGPFALGLLIGCIGGPEVIKRAVLGLLFV